MSARKHIEMGSEQTTLDGGTAAESDEYSYTRGLKHIPSILWKIGEECPERSTEYQLNLAAERARRKGILPPKEGDK
jgi:hypothetical protein